MTGLLVSLTWCALSLLALNALAIRFDWWSFQPGLPSALGVPLEPWLGWTVLWGAVVPLIVRDRSVLPALLGLAWFDLLAMPALGPVLVLRGGWLWGEALALAGIALPGLLFFRWTCDRTQLRARASLQVICAGAAMLWIVPTVAFESSGGWAAVLARPRWYLSLAVQVLLIPTALGLRAVAEFVERGRGTPIPFDPPEALVTTGPYAYIRNPMQLSMVLIFIVTAAALQNPLLLAAAGIAFAYGSGIAAWHEGIDLGARFGTGWTSYSSRVGDWVPAWRPAVETPATLFVAFSCGTCSSVGRWFLSHQPIGLQILPAEEAEDPALRRVTYSLPGGPPARGVKAIAKALEHVHLGWAVVGWVLLLPGVSWLAQLLADVCGPAAQRVVGRPYDPHACRVKRGSDAILPAANPLRAGRAGSRGSRGSAVAP
jgi:protein-S-isoprenylcysteine O-methyltransferase Ste14